MADFALCAMACESAFRPAGTFETAYSHNRREAIENIVDADPVAARVREIMTDRAHWSGSASDLLLAGSNLQRVISIIASRRATTRSQDLPGAL
jgi:hypothetical protein